MEDREAFGRRLKEARERRRLTLLQVGTLFGMSKAAIGHWETGTNVPRADQVAILADELGIDVGWLLHGRQPAWPFTEQLRAMLISQPDDFVRRLENGLRAHFDLPAIGPEGNEAAA